MSAELLSNILANTPGLGGSKINFSNNNLNDINWVAGLSDPGEMIGCGMYQQLRRLSGENDENYQKRLVVLMAQLPVNIREKIETAMKAAAIKRAGLDMSNGRVNVYTAGIPPWHRLGTNVSEAQNSEHAEKLSGLDFEMELRALFYMGGDGSMKLNKGKFGIVRKDTDAILGAVGNRYKIIQNKEGFAFLDSLLKEFDARYATAGSLSGGELVWMQLILPKASFKIGKEDVTEAYATFMNPNNGVGAGKCFPTENRVYCNNTLKIATNKDGKDGISIRHTGDINEKLDDARNALIAAHDGFKEYSELAQVMAKTKVEPKQYFHGLLDEVMELTQADILKGSNVWEAVMKATNVDAKKAAQEKFDKEAEKYRSVFDDLVYRYQQDRIAEGGTLWRAFNSVTESANYGKLGGRQKGSDRDRLETKFSSIMNGPADKIQQVALTQAKALAA